MCSAQVVPVHPELNDYAIEVRDKLRHLGYMVDANVNDSEVGRCFLVLLHVSHLSHFARAVNADILLVSSRCFADQ